MGILGELWVKLGLKTDKFKKGTQDAKGQVNGLVRYMQKLGGMMATAFSVKEIVKFTHQAAELANRAKGVRDAFNKLGDPTLLNNLRKATSGTVDDLQLMQRAVQASNFKIPLDQLSTYLNFATKRARETGMSVDYLVDSIITGLGRQSVMILDNLGISAAEIRDNMKDGASMAEAVGKIINEQMGGAAVEIDNAANATERLAAAWKNFQLAIGEDTKGPWNWIKGKAADKLDEMSLILNSKDLDTFSKYYAILSPLARMSGYTQSVVDWEKKKAVEDLEKAKKEAAEYRELIESGEFIGPMSAAAANTTETTAAKGLIQQLEEEIKKKEELRNLSANKDEIRQYNNEIAALKEKLRLLQMTSEELRKQHDPISKMSGMFDPMAMEENKNKGIAILNDATAQWQEKTLQLNEAAVKQQAITLEAINMLNSALTQGVTASLGELANVIAGVEGANVGNVVKALLSPLADAAISAGLLIMTTGEGIEALREGLTKFFGIGAIAAGAALMAVGVAAKAGLAAIGRGSSGAGGYANQNVTSYSGGYGVNGNNYQQDNNFALSATLKGQDLLLSIQRTQQNNRR